MSLSFNVWDSLDKESEASRATASEDTPMLRSLLHNFIFFFMLLSASIWTLLATGCNEDNYNSLDDTGYTYDLSEQQAMTIAMTGMDETVYTATSSIVGPMAYQGEDIIAFEVTVNGGDHMYLRYVDANTGKLMADMDVRHEIPQEGSGADAEIAPPSYYTSCPAGWALCIRTPSNIEFYSQNDPAYACQYLGNSTYYTLGGSSYGATCSHAMHSAGCLVSAYAMEMAYTGHGNNSPSVLNAQKGCFSGANVNGSCMARAFGASYSTISVNSVWSTLASGTPVVVYGTSNCFGNSTHAQMIWGHDGSRYWTKDPWYDWPNQDQPMCMITASYRLLR